MMVSCGECGEQVSTTALACPSCGAPTNKGRFDKINRSAGSVAGLLLIVVILLVIMGVAMTMCIF